jgi:hypothetical protein
VCVTVLLSETVLYAHSNEIVPVNQVRPRRVCLAWSHYVQLLLRKLESTAEETPCLIEISVSAVMGNVARILPNEHRDCSKELSSGDPDDLITCFNGSNTRSFRESLARREQEIVELHRRCGEFNPPRNATAGDRQEKKNKLGRRVYTLATLGVFHPSKVSDHGVAILVWQRIFLRVKAENPFMAVLHDPLDANQQPFVWAFVNIGICERCEGIGYDAIPRREYAGVLALRML